MGSLLGDLPSYDPQNFSEISPSDPSKPTRATPVTYHPTHDRTQPPPDQVIKSESRNILIRHFYQPTHEKVRLKRVANETLTSEHETKHPRAHDPGSLG